MEYSIGGHRAQAPPELVEGVAAILRLNELARGLALRHEDAALLALHTQIAQRAARLRAYIDEAARLGWPGERV